MVLVTVRPCERNLEGEDCCLVKICAKGNITTSRHWHRDPKRSKIVSNVNVMLLCHDLVLRIVGSVMILSLCYFKRFVALPAARRPPGRPQAGSAALPVPFAIEREPSKIVAATV